jgi:hypothetical protein
LAGESTDGITCSKINWDTRSTTGESRGRHNQRSLQTTLHPRTRTPTNKNPTVPTPPLTRKQKEGIATKGRGGGTTHHFNAEQANVEAQGAARAALHQPKHA